MKLCITFSLTLCSLVGIADAISRRHSSAATSGQLRGEPAPPPKDTDNLAHEVVDQATTYPSAKQFAAVDLNGDGRILEWEYLETTKADARLATYRFTCSDTNVDHALDPKEFDDAQASPKDLARCVGSMFAFHMIDKNQDGSLSQKELWQQTVGDVRYGQRWAFMVACSDRNQDGKVSPMEFSKDIYGCVEDKTLAANTEFADFNKTDTNQNNCTDQAEMAEALKNVLGHDLLANSSGVSGESTDELARQWIACSDANLDGCLEEPEYKTLISPPPEQAHCMGSSYERFEYSMDFEIMDKNNNGKVSRQEYYDWIARVNVDVDHKEAEAIFTSADTNKDEFIDRAEFEAAGTAHEGDGPEYLFLHTMLPGRKTASRTPVASGAKHRSRAL